MTLLSPANLSGVINSSHQLISRDLRIRIRQKGKAPRSQENSYFSESITVLNRENSNIGCTLRKYSKIGC
jgi:hypothetical protein